VEEIESTFGSERIRQLREFRASIAYPEEVDVDRKDLVEGATLAVELSSELSLT